MGWYFCEKHKIIRRGYFDVNQQKKIKLEGCGCIVTQDWRIKKKTVMYVKGKRLVRIPPKPTKVTWKLEA